MDKRKVKILMAVTPPGFCTAVIENDKNGKPQKVVKHNICQPGDVIEIPAELAEKYFKSSIAGPADKSERVTKVPNNGAFANVESGPKESNPVPAKANGNDVQHDG